MNIGLRLYYREHEENFGLVSHIPSFGYRLMAGAVQLRLRLELLGHRLIPLSQANLESIDMVLVFDIDNQIYQEILQLPPSIPCILICMESPIYAPYSHDLSILSNPRWHKILTWNRTVCLPNVNYYDIPLADGIPLDINPNLSAVSRKGVAIANPAKSQQGFLPQRDALYLELAAREFIDLYGNHWPYMPEQGLYGSTENKITKIEAYSYSLIIENCLCSGYVTEKLADSILAGRPAIYYGDTQIAQIKFPNTFVKLKELSPESFLEARSEVFLRKCELEESMQRARAKSYHWCTFFTKAVLVAMNTESAIIAPVM
jgi:hypothetical protein